jgi:tol-pal system protein YbgF
MTSRSLFMGVIALPILISGAISTNAASHEGNGLPGVFSSQSAPVAYVDPGRPAAPGLPVQLAQASDPRVTALEEQVRQLNGTIEELNFLILQMQEQLRKMQEDNEFRFQELEGKRSQANGTDRRAAEAPATPAPEPPPVAAQASPPADAAPPVRAGEALPRLGEPERNLGTITFDANGNPSGGSITTEPLPEGADPEGSDETVVAALPSGSDPEELYRNAYQFILSGDYATAETGFRDYIERYPEDEHAADAHFWLGESLLGQERHRDAAEIFLAANRQFPQSGKAPDMLLKLGVSLAALNQRDIACATYREIGQRYPQASTTLKDRVRQEQSLAGC